MYTVWHNIYLVSDVRTTKKIVMKKLTSFISYLFSERSDNSYSIKSEIKKIKAVLKVLKPQREEVEAA